MIKAISSFRERRHLVCTGAKMRTIAELSLGTVYMRRQWSNVFKY